MGVPFSLYNIKMNSAELKVVRINLIGGWFKLLCFQLLSTTLPACAFLWYWCCFLLAKALFRCSRAFCFESRDLNLDYNNNMSVLPDGYGLDCMMWVNPSNHYPEDCTTALTFLCGFWVNANNCWNCWGQQC